MDRLIKDRLKTSDYHSLDASRGTEGKGVSRPVTLNLCLKKKNLKKKIWNVCFSRDNFS